MNQRHPPNFHRLLALLLAVVLCLTLAGPALAADDATASSIRLAKTEGTVSATNSAGRSVSLVKNLRLFNGYHVKTEAKSYAWLNLDSAKLLKEDASSNVEVRKSGKKLEVLVSSGNLFFNVTEPLDDDETLNIRTSTTLTGVRGTCGWVEVVDRWNTNVYILEGKVECAVTDPVSGEEELTTISAGETATFTVRSAGASATNGVKITKTSCDVKDVPGYVLVDLAGDRQLCNDIRNASGLDILGELSKGGDPAAEAQRRLEAEESAAASRLASIAAREQAQASNVESAANTPADASGDLTMVGNWGWKLDKNTKTLYIEGSGDMTGYYSVRYGAFTYPWREGYVDSKEIESAVIGAGITGIGDFAFYGCSDLTRVTIPDSVTSIGYSAFNGCSSLTSVIIPDGVTSIENATFQSCTRLTSVTIPDTVTRIESNAFDNCSSLRDVNYGGSAEQWSAININSVGNNSLTSAAIHYAGASGTPGDLNTEGTWDWRYDGSTKTLYIEGSGAMDDFSSSRVPWLDHRQEIESVVIGEGITYIGNNAFYQCFSLTRAVIPSSVTGIGQRAFIYCNKLTNVTIPSGVTSIGQYAFSGCRGITSVTIPSGMTGIETGVFQACTGLTSVTISSSVTSIGVSAFNGCYGLTSVTIPNSVTIIEERAFENCTGLTGVTIPSRVTSIGKQAFHACDSLASVTIPSSVTSIGDFAFWECPRLTSITIPSSVTSIGPGAFAATGLTSITIPSSITSIGIQTFLNCESLTSITIPSSVTSIEGGAFSNCPSLANVNYGGNAQQWSAITIESANDALTSAAIHYNSR